MLYQSTLISDAASAEALIAEIIHNSDRDEAVFGIGFDIETEVVPDGIFGFSGAWVTAQFAARNLKTGWSKVAVVEVWKTGVDFMRPLVDSGLPLIAHNAGFEALFLRRHGLAVANWRDTMLADGILRLGTQRFYRSLDVISRIRLGWDLGGKDTIRVSFKPETELTPEQITYAEMDALAALFLHTELARDLATEGLETAYLLEMGALPAATEMTMKGLPFDAEAWRSEVLSRSESEIAAAESALADLTGDGAQMDLFGGVSLSWKPDSALDLRRILNEYEDPERLSVIFEGREQLDFGADDKADSTVLARLKNAGSPLAAALLTWRHWSKLSSTYGEKILALLGTDGAFHPSYKQAIVSTGRWASENPNGQNLAPEMKGYFRAPEGQVFIMADYSNMEMRVGASEANDQILIEAFAADRDIHSNTAALMFGYDLEEFLEKLAAKDPDAVMDRKKAKPVNFGNFYGLGPRSLWESFQAEGLEITQKECQQLIDDWYNAYPGVKAWVEARDKFVAAASEELTKRVDWDLTDELDTKTRTVVGLKAWLKRKYGRRAYPDEIAAADRDLTYEDVIWTESFGEPVLLDYSGRPIEFVSETISGRKRRFQVATEGWWTAQLHVILGNSRAIETLHEDWMREGYEPLRLKLRKDGSASRKAIELAFSDKTLKRRFVRWVWERYPARAQSLKMEAAKTQIQKLTNAYRNAPVQGGAAEPMLSAIGSLWLELRRDYPEAYIVQTVHDSLVLMAPEGIAVEVADLVRKHMSEGFRRFFGDRVPIKVDIEVGKTLLSAEKSDTTWDLDEFRALQGSVQAVA